MIPLPGIKVVQEGVNKPFPPDKSTLILPSPSPLQSMSEVDPTISIALAEVI